MPDPAPAPDAPSADADLTGRTLGDFRVLRTLGHGGMGRVYLARQLSLKRDVALKLLRDDLARDATALQRFQAEAEAVARISHPNIVQVYAVGEHAGLRFMALEYVEGRNLRDYLDKKGPPELPVALAVIRQVASALQRAGEAGIVHRDVKPDNILLTRRAEAKVTDFGLARLAAGGEEQPLNLTQTGVTLGTPLYMAPEQVQGKPVDHRTDIYALGVTCYHLFAGRPPFGGATAFEVAMKHVQDHPEPLARVRPDLPPDLCGMVHKMMAKAPADRYQTAREIIRDLAKVRGAAPGSTAPAALSLAMTGADAAPGSGGPPAAATGGPAVPQGTTINLPVPRLANLWPTRALGGLALAGLAVGGWWAYARTHRAPPPAAAAAGSGLPEARPPGPVVGARERELLGRVEKRGAKPAEVAEALLDLGLLYVRERRWDDADRVFRELEGERFDRDRPRGPGFQPYKTAARFGRGIVLADQDKPAESVRAFEEGLPPNPARARPVLILTHAFLAEHPDLARAVSEALHRDAENLKAEKKALPPALDVFRIPGAGERAKP